MTDYPYEDDPEFDEFADDGCWRCHGEGGWHDCGEDSCCCLDPEAIDEYWVWCPECRGRAAL